MLANEKTRASRPPDPLARARPHLHQRAPEIQPYGKLVRYPIALDEKTRAESVGLLNQVLVDTMMLRDLYKKHHWQTAGASFYELHLLYDKHHKRHAKLVDKLAERVQTLGGVAIAMAADVAEMTTIPRPPRGREEVPVQLSRLLEAHEMLILAVRKAVDRTAQIRRPRQQRLADQRRPAHQRDAGLVSVGAPGQRAAGRGLIRCTRPVHAAARRRSAPLTFLDDPNGDSVQHTTDGEPQRPGQRNGGRQPLSPRSPRLDPRRSARRRVAHTVRSGPHRARIRCAAGRCSNGGDAISVAVGRALIALVTSGRPVALEGSAWARPRLPCPARLCNVRRRAQNYDPPASSARLEGRSVSRAARPER